MSTPIKCLIQNLNLVIGCDIGCPYCYARNNCRRFHMTDDFDVPVFFERKLRLMENPKPHTWLLTGMSDLAGWEPEWVERTFERMRAHPEHSFIFLTKRPERLDLPIVPDNAWVGVTVTRASELRRIDELRGRVRGGHLHVTFEPLFEDLGPIDFSRVEWTVVGTETGRRRGKVDARPEWVASIARQARDHGVLVFMKEALEPIMGDESMVQELPKSFATNLR
jgi:radical SAM mobile pair protein A